MKNLRWIVPALLLGLATPGCVLVSGQFLIDFDLDNFHCFDAMARSPSKTSISTRKACTRTTRMT